MRKLNDKTQAEAMTFCCSEYLGTKDEETAKQVIRLAKKWEKANPIVCGSNADVANRHRERDRSHYVRTQMVYGIDPLTIISLISIIYKVLRALYDWMHPAEESK